MVAFTTKCTNVRMSCVEDVKLHFFGPQFLFLTLHAAPLSLVSDEMHKELMSCVT